MKLHPGRDGMHREHTAGAVDEDRERWFGGIEARMVIAVESGWLERIRSTTLYRYEMPPASFRLLDENAGHWVSEQRLEPVSVEPVGDLLEALAASNVELRVTPRKPTTSFMKARRESASWRQGLGGGG